LAHSLLTYLISNIDIVITIIDDDNIYSYRIEIPKIISIHLYSVQRECLSTTYTEPCSVLIASVILNIIHLSPSQTLSRILSTLYYKMNATVSNIDQKCFTVDPLIIPTQALLVGLDQIPLMVRYAVSRGNGER